MHRVGGPGGRHGSSGRSRENLRWKRAVSNLETSRGKESIWQSSLETSNVIDGLAVTDEKETHFQRRGCRNMVDDGGGVTWRAAPTQGISYPRVAKSGAAGVLGMMRVLE